MRERREARSAAQDREVEGTVPSQWWLDLKIENQRLRSENTRFRKTLESIVSEYDGYMGTGQMLREFAQEALDG